MDSLLGQQISFYWSIIGIWHRIGSELFRKWRRDVHRKSCSAHYRNKYTRSHLQSTFLSQPPHKWQWPFPRTQSARTYLLETRELKTPNGTKNSDEVGPIKMSGQCKNRIRKVDRRTGVQKNVGMTVVLPRTIRTSGTSLITWMHKSSTTVSYGRNSLRTLWIGLRHIGHTLLSPSMILSEQMDLTIIFISELSVL